MLANLRMTYALLSKDPCYTVFVMKDGGACIPLIQCSSRQGVTSYHSLNDHSLCNFYMCT